MTKNVHSGVGVPVPADLRPGADPHLRPLPEAAARPLLQDPGGFSPVASGTTGTRGGV